MWRCWKGRRKHQRKRISQSKLSLLVLKGLEPVRKLGLGELEKVGIEKGGKAWSQGISRILNLPSYRVRLLV